MVGYVKNFKIKVREDGGYDCTTSIISMGEILEGLKGRKDFGELKTTEDEKGQIYDNFEVYMISLTQYMAAKTGMAEYEDFTRVGKMFRRYNKRAKNVANPWRNHDISQEFATAFSDIFNKGTLVIYGQGDQEGEDLSDASDNASYERNYWNRTNRVKIEKALKAKSDHIEHFLVHKGEKLGFGAEGSPTQGDSAYNYIRWDLVCEIMNEFVLENATYTPMSNGDTKPEAIKNPLARISYTHDTGDDLQDRGEYLEYSSYGFEPDIKIPILIPTDGDEDETFGEDYVSLSEMMDGSMNPAICLFPHQINSEADPTKKAEGTLLLGTDRWKDKPHKVSASNRAIGLIYINIDYLLGTYKDMRYDGQGGDNEKFSVLAFIKKVWEEDITGACAGTHKFMFHMPGTGIGRVIDVEMGNSLPKKADIAEIKIQDRYSIVRDFNFNTTIDKKLSSTIAIAAQAPKNVANLDQLSFAAFNKNIKNRFMEQKIDFTTSKENREKLELDVCKLASDIWDFKNTMIKGDEESLETTVNVENAINKLQLLEKKVLELSMTYPLICPTMDAKKYPPLPDHLAGDTNKLTDYDSCVGQAGNPHPVAGQLRPDATVSRSSIVPLKFNFQMDGIGGIVIGNIFKVQASKLPIGYQADDIAFVVMGINHKISSGL